MLDTARTETPGPTAARILSTARQLFMQRGYRAVSISDIVSAAEITKPTLYYHFADKEELFVQMVLHMLDEMRAEMSAALAPYSDTVGRLTALTSMIQASPSLDSRMVRQEAREHLNAEHQRRISAAFYASMFAPIREVMVAAIVRGELAGHSADELTILFLCLMEGFHFQSETHSSAAAQLPNSPFATVNFSPAMIVQIFLHGVAGAERAKPE